MTRYQRARRLAYWRGFALSLLVFTAWVGALGLAQYITS